jgi:putative oxidoreductase
MFILFVNFKGSRVQIMMKKYVDVLLRIIVAVILLQTLFYKFSAHPDSVYIFEQIGMEPFGRIGIGILELIAAILILLPATVWLGAGLTVGIIAGAVFFHLTKIGIEVQGDGGLLFYMAIGTLVFSLILLWFRRKSIPFIGNGL